MHAPTDNVTPPRSVLMRLPGWSMVFRHPRPWTGVLFASGSWNLFLGILTLSYGYWLGLLPLAGSAVVFWAGTRIYQITQSQITQSQITQSQPAAFLAGVHGR
jgi:hypothetical protein